MLDNTLNTARLTSVTNLTTATLTAPLTSRFIFGNATAQAQTVTLPDATLVPGLDFFVFKTDSTANTVTLSAKTGQLIDSALSLVFSSQFAGAAVQSNGTQWVVTSLVGASQAGGVGSLVTSVVASGSAVALTTAIPVNITSISLTPGTWDVTGAVDFHSGTGTTTTYLQGSASLTTGTIGSQDSGFSQTVAIATNLIDATEPLPVSQFVLSATTTIYLVAAAGFAISTLAAYGTLRARRVS